MFKKTYVLVLPALLFLFTNCKQAEKTIQSNYGPFTFTECDVMETPAKKMVEHHPEHFTFLEDVKIDFLDHESNGASLRGFIVQPKNPGKYPIIIYNRGGNRELSELIVGTAIQYMAPIAAQGYVVLATNYEGVNGGIENEEFGGADVAHVINLIKDAKTLPNADSTKIGLVGISRGGMMNYLVQKEAGDDIKIDASVNISAISDLEFTIKHHPQLEGVCEELIPDYKNNRKAELEKRSAIYWTDQLSDHTAQLILCGTSDQHVHYQQAIDLAEALKAANKPHKLVVYEGDNHGLRNHRVEVGQLIGQWLNEHVAQKVQ